jgi:hypothetical protein
MKFAPPCRSAHLAALCLIAVLAAPQAAWTQTGVSDPIFDGDFREPQTQEIVELQPGVPWIQPGIDGDLGTADDIIGPAVGDIDLVIRSGLMAFEGAIPLTSPNRGAIPLAIVEAFAGGTPVPFVVVPSDGLAPPAAGMPILSPELEGKPVLVIAFADLDDDGYIGVTELDGDPLDWAIEESELDPFGRRFAFFQDGQASGELFVGAGAPPGRELRLVLTAFAYVGPTSPDFFGGVVPEGPAVMTRQPTLLRTAPDDVIEGNLPPPPDPDEPVGVQIEDHFTPDPMMAYGEAFSLPTDGSGVSFDIVASRSGSLAGFGIARPVDTALFDPTRNLPLRPGFSSAGVPALLEILNAFDLTAEDVAQGSLRLLPLDQLGNVTEPAETQVIFLVASGALSILSPDLDQDPSREVVAVSDAAGAAIELDGAGTLGIEILVPEPSKLAIELTALLVLAVLVWSRSSLLMRPESPPLTERARQGPVARG